MSLSLTVATCKLESIAPYSQSRKHEDPKLEGELPEDYDRRTWRSKSLIENGTIHIPAAGFHQAVVAGARYDGTQIAGQGKKTWARKFESGLALFENIDLGVKSEDLDYIDIYAHVNGKRGSGARVMRRFPLIVSWTAIVGIHVLDPIVKQNVLAEAIEVCGMFVGIGRYSPRVGGTNGRFKLVDMQWAANRQFVTKLAA